MIFKQKLWVKDCTRRQRFGFWLLRKLIMYSKFNGQGLRWPTSFLAAVKPNLHTYPLEVVAWFVDAVVVERVKTYDADLIRRVSEMDSLYYNHTNTTSLGNIAYIALYHEHYAVSNWAKELIKDCFIDHKNRR